MNYCEHTWCEAHLTAGQHSTNCPNFAPEVWGIDIRWSEAVATVEHTALVDQSSRRDAERHLTGYVNGRDLHLERPTHTAHAASWDVIDGDGNVVGAAAIALVD